MLDLSTLTRKEIHNLKICNHCSEYNMGGNTHCAECGGKMGLLPETIETLKLIMACETVEELYVICGAEWSCPVIKTDSKED